MAGLTKEQRAERKAQELAQQQANEQANTQTAENTGGNADATETQPQADAGGNQKPALTDGGDNDGDESSSNTGTEQIAGAESTNEKLTELANQLNQELATEETVLMVRSEPEHPGGPVEADVHAGEVGRWKEFGWTVAVQEE